MVFLLLAVLLYSFRFWTINYPDNLGINEQMFYVAVGIAIVTSISQWLEGRINAIITSVDLIKYKGGVHGRGNVQR